MEDIIKIIVTDDKDMYRRLIREMLAPFPVAIIGEATNGKELLELLNSKKPDVILLDLEMPVMDGNKAFAKICREWPGSKIIILSSYYESVLVEDYLERGAKGYIPKDELEPNLLMNALLKIKAGGSFVYSKPDEQNIKFSARQKEIMPLLFEGMTSEEIGQIVCMTTRSVDKQRHKLYEKTGAGRIVDFYKYAFTRGLQFLGRQPRRKRKLA